MPEIPEIDAPLGKGIDITAAESEVSNALKTLETLGVDTTAANNAYFDFLTANAETKAEKLNNAFSAIYTTIDNAIAQQQAAGIDTSALTALKAQLESALSGEVKISNVQMINPARQITTQAEKIVSTLQALPPTIKAKIGYDGVFNALLSAQMNGSNLELAQAALGKARAGVEAALEMNGLDAGTRAALEGMLGEIDSGKRLVDNNTVGSAKLILNNLDQRGFNEFIKRTSKVFSSEKQASYAFRKLINNDFDGFAALLDLSTKKDCATFWSKNKEAARNYAKTYNGTIMEDTLGGKVLDGWQWLNESFPEWGTGTPLDQKPLWESISRYYAMGVTGKVTVIHPENTYGDIYRFVEYKVLRYRMKKGYVTQIEEVFHDAAQ